MLWATLAVLRRPPLLDLSLELDGEGARVLRAVRVRRQQRLPMEGFDIGTREHLDGGSLSVYTTRGSAPSA